jgi:hypothetical protein
VIVLQTALHVTAFQTRGVEGSRLNNVDLASDETLICAIEFNQLYIAQLSGGKAFYCIFRGEWSALQPTIMLYIAFKDDWPCPRGAIVAVA